MSKQDADNEKNQTSEDEPYDPDTECGMGSCRPKFLQVFANITSFVGVYSAVGMITQTLSVYVNSQVPTLEKQFGLNSAQSGLLMSCNDIGFFVFILFAASIARFVHIPRFLGLCISLYGVSGIMCSLPHFISISKGLLPSPSLTSDNSPGSNVSLSPQEKDRGILCTTRYNFTYGHNGTCEDNASTDGRSVLSAPAASIKTTAMAFIAIGMVFQGIGKAPRYPLFAMYVDDNGDRRKTGFYAGLVIALSICGPALSYGLGGLFSSIYVTLEDVDMSKRDPRWIGAWWLGFFVFGIVSLFVTIPILFFPRRMKIPKDVITKGKQYIRNAQVEGTLKEKVKDRLFAFWRVLKNPIFVCVVSGNTVLLLSVGGFLGFLTKYISSQFNLPLSTSNYILGGSNLSSVALGSFFGGLLTRLIPMTPRNSLLLVVVLYIVTAIIFSFGFFLGCEPSQIIGPSSIHGTSNDISAHCNSNCQCMEYEYFPVCGSNGMTYHSPCYAGCNDMERGGRVYTNCTCIPDGNANAGLCPSNCKMLYYWVAAQIVGSLIGALSISPSYIVCLRCVEDKDKSTAVGLNAFMTSVFGWALGPVIYGKMVDTTCKIWQSPCESKGACELYDTDDFRIKLYALSISLRVTAITIVSLAFVKVRKWKHWTQNSLPAAENLNPEVVINKSGTTEIHSSE